MRVSAESKGHSPLRVSIAGLKPLFHQKRTIQHSKLGLWRVAHPFPTRGVPHPCGSKGGNFQTVRAKLLKCFSQLMAVVSCLRHSDDLLNLPTAYSTPTNCACWGPRLRGGLPTSARFAGCRTATFLLIVKPQVFRKDIPAALRTSTENA